MPHDFFSFFVYNIEKPIVWCISAKENYYNLTKNCRKFHTSITERCTSLSKHYCFVSAKSFQSTCERAEPLKNLYYTWTPSQVIFKVSVNFFSPIYLSTYLQKPVCVLYTTHILYSHSYLYKVFFPVFTIPETESERKISLSFWIKVATS